MPLSKQEEIEANRQNLITTYKPTIANGARGGLVSIKRGDLATLCGLDFDALKNQGSSEKTANEERLDAIRDEKAKVQAEIEEQELEELKAKRDAKKPATKK